MVDRLTQKQRSYCMSRIRSKNTRIEGFLAKAMKKAGIKFRRYPRIYGSPDFLVGDKAAVFVDGCFWHMCPKHYRKPKTRNGFWKTKISRNVKRDAEVNRRLKKEGYAVIRVWEHEIEKSLEKIVIKIVRLIRR